MKNKITFIILGLSVLICLSTGKTSAQQFKAGDNVIGVGIGLGDTYGYSSASSSPALSAQYEHGNWEVGGPGCISLGGFLAYKSYSYEGAYPGYSYSQKWSYTIIGIRSAYHYTGLKGSMFDPYGGLMLSYEIASSSFTSSNPSTDYLYNTRYGSRLRFSLYLGGRYYFSNNWAAYAELGFGNAILTVGAAYKF